MPNLTTYSGGGTQRNKLVLRSNFPAAKRAMWGAVGAARDHALNVGEDEAETRIERHNNARGYNIPANVEQEKTGFQSGRIWFPEFWGRFFEYGTLHIAPMPFMRPAHRKMRKAFIKELGDEAPKWIRRKAAI